MIEKITDWKGNEVKAGMTIYFVQTKPGILESSRSGILMPATGESIWEDEKVWLERKNKEVWELGQPYAVEEKEGRLFYTINKNEDVDTFSSSFAMAYAFGEPLTIAIKGISDKKE